MKTIQYRIRNSEGLHAQPAADILKLLGNRECSVYVTKNQRTVNMMNVFEVLSLHVQCGDEITITLEGRDEENICEEILQYLQEYL